MSRSWMILRTAVRSSLTHSCSDQLRTSFDGDGLGQVARLVHVGALLHGHVIGQQLDRGRHRPAARSAGRRRGAVDHHAGAGGCVLGALRDR